MPITSYAFFLLFLPLSLLFYWRVFKDPAAKLWFLAAASYFFFALAGLQFLPLLLALSSFTYWAAIRRYYSLGIVFNIAALALFKYWNFGAANINDLFSALGVPFLVPLLTLGLPLGLSYFVFKHIGYLIDVRKARCPASQDLLAFLTFSAFFPQISAGPISSFQDTGVQLRALPRRLPPGQAYTGLAHLSIGLTKKLLIADSLQAMLGFEQFAQVGQSAGFALAWIYVLGFAMQLYFDFSGYTDIVLGVAHLFGVTLPPNFDNPYLASNPRQFWQRWHISLSTWFQVYLFAPLSRSLLGRFGRSRRQAAQYLANLLTMGLIGLWHGAGWGFVLWGLYHGLLLNLHAWAVRKNFRFKSQPLSHAALLLAVLFGWALFLSPNFVFAKNLFLDLLGMNGLGSIPDASFIFAKPVFFTFVVAWLAAFSGVAEAADLARRSSPKLAFAFGILLILAITFLGGASDFAYIQF
ncbi:MAG: hypothetical protein OEZ02_01325 [Anaerolineae bacterium]|nr:hypothetical protein [Anaerolineae bacterium]